MEADDTNRGEVIFVYKERSKIVENNRTGNKSKRLNPSEQSGFPRARESNDTNDLTSATQLALSNSITIMSDPLS